MSADEFSRRLSQDEQIRDKRYAFFLGAGCSVSAGIPAAGQLVKDRWLSQLHKLRGPDRSFGEWMAQDFPTYTEACAASFYSNVMGELFPTERDRQQEIELLCSNCYPGFAYATLAALMSRPQGQFNILLTTNFDDMVADALYLYTTSRPLVIQHERLADYIEVTRTRPLVVKLHGDAHLSPKNTPEETEELASTLRNSVQHILHERGIIFLGYGGNDRSIHDLLRTLPRSSLRYGVYWVSSEEPKGLLRGWLGEREACFVQVDDFDRFMLLIRHDFDIPPPSAQRFLSLFEEYQSTFERLRSSVSDRSGQKLDAFQRAATSACEIISAEAAEVAAIQAWAQDPDTAEEIYEAAIKAYPGTASLLGNYALFLQNVRGESDRAEDMYEQSLQVDPLHAGNLSNFARFLKNVRKDMDRAEGLYIKAIEVAPENVTCLGNYARFLKDIRRNFKASMEIYSRAVKADQSNANNLGNYAQLLLADGQTREGEYLVAKALALRTNMRDLTVELRFYVFAHDLKRIDPEPLPLLRRLLEAGYRSRGWNFQPTIDRAVEGGHLDAPWLSVLADVITADEDLSVLSKWERWQQV